MQDSSTHLVRFFFSPHAPTLPTVPTEDAILLESSTEEAAQQLAPSGEPESKEEESMSPGTEIAIISWLFGVSELCERAGIGIGTVAVEFACNVGVLVTIGDGQLISGDVCWIEESLGISCSWLAAFTGIKSWDCIDGTTVDVELKPEKEQDCKMNWVYIK